MGKRTIVLMAYATIFVNLRCELNADIFDGLSGGCWNAFLGSSVSQYSSSTSSGSSASNLYEWSQSENINRRRILLFFARTTRPSKGSACYPIVKHENPKRSFPELPFSVWFISVNFLPVSPDILCFAKTDANEKPCHRMKCCASQEHAK